MRTLSALPRKILLIDDDPIFTGLLTSTLKASGFNVTSSLVGTNILSMIEKENIELVLLDVVLSDGSGNQVLEEIRSKYNPTSLPVIMLTANDDPTSIVAHLQNGASDYLIKPINMEVTFARIMAQLTIADLCRENLRRQKDEGVYAMIMAMNEELSTPLAIALGYLRLGIANEDPKVIEKAQMAIERIAEVIRKINVLIKDNPIQTVQLKDGKTMVKID